MSVYFSNGSKGEHVQGQPFAQKNSYHMTQSCHWHLDHSLLVRSKSRIPPMLKRRTLHKAVDSKRQEASVTSVLRRSRFPVGWVDGQIGRKEPRERGWQGSNIYFALSLTLISYKMTIMMITGLSGNLPWKMQIKSLMKCWEKVSNKSSLFLFVILFTRPQQCRRSVACSFSE